MRTIHVTPLIAALMLAACGGGSADDNGDGKISNQEAAAAADQMVKQQPGQYQVTAELLDYEMPDVPGMTDEMKAQLRTQMGSALAQGSSFCLTPEEAAQGPQKAIENMAESNCSFAKLDIAGGNISTDMQCTGADGTTNRMTMEGTMTSTSSDMVMTAEQNTPTGKVNMKMRMISQRTGDCA